MGAKLSIERIRSFPGIAYEDLFHICDQILSDLDLKITKSDKSLGTIEARSKSWLFKPAAEVFVTVHREFQNNGC